MENGTLNNFFSSFLLLTFYPSFSSSSSLCLDIGDKKCDFLDTVMYLKA